jgi:hypothetical protein
LCETAAKRGFWRSITVFCAVWVRIFRNPKTVIHNPHFAGLASLHTKARGVLALE